MYSNFIKDYIVLALVYIFVIDIYIYIVPMIFWFLIYLVVDVIQMRSLNEPYQIMKHVSIRIIIKICLRIACIFIYKTPV